MLSVPVPALKEIAKDVIVAILGASVGLAGLLLVFVGFVYARAESFETRRGDRYRFVAKIGLLPVCLSLGAAWLCMCWLGGNPDAYGWAVLLFKISLIGTGLYGLMALLFYQ